MRQDHCNDWDRFDPLDAWANQLREGLITEIPPRRAAEIATVAGAALVTSTALASAASAAVSQGGITMSIGQTIASGGGMKLAAGGLAAALALGGGAMATGNLACEFPASATQAEGNLFVQTGIDGSAEAQVEQRTIEVEGLGFVDVAHDDVNVEVLGIRLEDGSTAEVTAEGQGGAEIAFTLDGVIRTLLISVVDGDLFAGMAGSSHVSGAGDAAIEVEADANSEGALGIDLDADANSDGALGIDLDADANSEGVLGIDLDADGDGVLDSDADFGITGDVDAESGGILDGLGLGGVTSILGGFGLDVEANN